MKLKHLLSALILFSTQAFAQTAVDELWERLNADFESKAYFFNAAINNERNEVMSSFIPRIFGDAADNNARPLTPWQLDKLPDASFLNKIPFKLVMAGRERLLKMGKITNNPIVAVVDFSLHSQLRRLFIFDVQKGEVLINFWVSHATASDKDDDGFAETFSNLAGSKMSSLGFMTTDVTYVGRWGYSMRMKGLDPKLNSKVFPRAVVIHGLGGLGAHDAAWDNIATSEGCLMISTNESGRFWGMEDKSMLELVIKTLTGGALIFTYSEEKDEQGKELILQSSWINESDMSL
jgi:hypothetical protein